MAAPAAKRDLTSLPASRTELVAFDISPFPYRGAVPGSGRPFLDITEGERRGHYSARFGGSARNAFASAPVVIAAYSGGYYPAAFILQHGRADERLRGVILLDALYGDHEKFAEWLTRYPSAFFVSAFGKSAREDNEKLQRMLKERGLHFQRTLPRTLARGSVTFIAADDEVKHEDFVTEAWVKHPLRAVLRRIPGFSRKK